MKEKPWFRGNKNNSKVKIKLDKNKIINAKIILSSRENPLSWVSGNNIPKVNILNEGKSIWN